jgi:hypothetical protein
LSTSPAAAGGGELLVAVAASAGQRGIIPGMDLARARGATPRPEPLSPLIKWVLPGAVVALTIALLGGYEFHWSWTGVKPSDQLWDLLHVIVLPVVLATLPIWYRTRQRWMMEWHVVFSVVGLAFVVLVVGGYAFNWGWTGFKGNTLWDWLELLALPVVVASLPLWFATNKRSRAGGAQSAWRGWPSSLWWSWVGTPWTGVGPASAAIRSGTGCAC